MTSPRLAATAEGREHWRRARERLEAGYRQVLASLKARGQDIVMELIDRSAPTSAPFSLSARLTYAGVPGPRPAMCGVYASGMASSTWDPN